MSGAVVAQGSATKPHGSTGLKAKQCLSDKIISFLVHGMQLAEVDPSLPTRVLPPLLELCLAALAFVGHPEQPFPLPVKHQSTHGTTGIPCGVACNVWT